ncbi:hypothetical protein LIER_26210 [Lithospermum erythrorhizon]|uniref:Transposase (putative) gypsy type domain-containing protein n=1 Tax=Lithospermum erythrorhizon TaxID=34254 RepID=A0AAV3RBU2_LITER
MSDNSSSRCEGRGYNSDVGSYSTPQVFSSLADLAGSIGSRELSKRDLVSLKARYELPSSEVMRCPKATEPANAPPPGLRSIFVVALENGMRLPVHRYVGDVLSMGGGGGIFLTELTPNMWISINGFYSACLLAGVTPMVKPQMKGFCEAFLSKVDPESWRPYFFFVSGEGLPADANKRPMPLHFYSDHRVLKAAGLTPSSDADLRALEALRVTYNVHDHAPPPPPAAPATSSGQQPLR